MNKERIKAKIISGVGGRYTVRTATADGSVLIKKIPAKGAFRYEKITPLPGDIVYVERDGGSYVITDITERKNELIRPPMANLDILYIVISCKKPDPVSDFADKLTVLCEQNGIKPVIVVTKTELSDMDAENICNIYGNIGYKCFSVSSYTGEGVEELRKYINDEKGAVCAFCGASGVGKSTLLNTLFPSLGCEVGDISEKTERGKNTTRRITLYEIMPDTYLADTPGFSLLDFEKFDFCTKEELPYLFPEFEPYLCKCKYTKCSHTKEEGCLIREAVNQGKINIERYNSYLSIYNDIKDKKEWMK